MSENSLFKVFRRQFITGILILLPLITTVILVSWLFRLVDQILGRYFARLIGEYIYGVGFVSLILLIWIAGVIGRTYLGAKLNSLKDLVLTRIPLIGSVFSSIKQVSDGFLELDQSNFEQVVMVEYPRKGLYAVGFVTSRKNADVLISGNTPVTEPVAHVFLPTVPNPTSGFILLVPEKEIHRLNLSVEDGLKLVLSLGMIHPHEYRVEKFQSLSRSAQGPGTSPRV